MTDSVTKIIIVDYHPFVRRGMKKVIEQEANLSVVFEAGSTQEALSMIAREEPDLVIMDISMEQEENGFDLIKTIRSEFANIKILALSMHGDNISAERAFGAGVNGYLSKTEAPSAIIKAIRTVMKGNPYLHGNISKQVRDMILKE